MNQSTSIHAPESPASDTTFSVILKGVQHNALPADAIAQLASLFKVSQEQASSLLALSSYTVKKAVSPTMASQYKRAIEAAGGVCDLLPDNAPAMSIDITLPARTPDTAPSTSAPTSITRSAVPSLSDTNAMMAADSPIAHSPKNTMQNISELKEKIDTTTWHLVLLSIVTLGIYPLLWLTKHYQTINAVTKKRTFDMTFIIWIAVCIGLSYALKGTRNETLNVLFLILWLAGGILYIVWAFKAKAALQDYVLNEYKIELRMNAFYTLVFSICYINYCINDLPEVQRKNQILRGQTAA